LVADLPETGCILRKESATKPQNIEALNIQKELDAADYSFYWTGFTGFILTVSLPPVARICGPQG